MTVYQRTMVWSEVGDSAAKCTCVERSGERHSRVQATRRDAEEGARSIAGDRDEEQRLYAEKERGTGSGEAEVGAVETAENTRRV